MQAMDGWNRMDEKNVVVVHCKGGKGRTGVVIAAYMLHARLFDDTELAMEHFAMKRFKSTDRSKTGITQVLSFEQTISMPDSNLIRSRKDVMCVISKM